MDPLDERVARLEEELRDVKAQQAGRPVRKQQLGFGFGLGLVLFILAFGALAFYLSLPDFEGRLQLEKSPWGNVDDGIAECRSGAATYPQYYGAKLISKSGLNIKVIEDSSEGMLVLLWKDDFKNALKFSKQECPVFKVTNRLAHVRINNIDTMSGEVHVECPLPDGGRFVFVGKYDQCYR